MHEENLPATAPANYLMLISIKSVRRAIGYTVRVRAI